jgi:two-component system sensor histidine kinase HupT/HoxJ
MTHRTDIQQDSLIKEAGVMDSLQQTDSTEEAWIEVIHKMDSVYADLVHSQVELELKNTALEEAQLFINSVLSAMTDTLIVCDNEGIILQVNSALETLTGKTKEDYLQHSIHDVFSEDSQAMLDLFPEK